MKSQKSILVLGVVFVSLILMQIPSVSAFEPGKTYDKSNYTEIEDLLIPAVLNWVKKGEYILKTGEFEGEFGDFDDNFIKRSVANEGRFDMDSDGLMIYAKNGEPVRESLLGLPFPKIDTKDPKAAAKIMENHFAIISYGALSASSGRTQWVGRGGLERDLSSAMDFFFYQQRVRGAIPNPNNFLQQSLLFVLAPFDLRGTTQMSWNYNDPREDTAFAYVPMLRRVRRTSAAARSDPFMGSDATMDDANGYGGKNAVMTFKLLGEKKILVGFPNLKDNVFKVNPDGSYERYYHDLPGGYNYPEWQGIPWAPVNGMWATRDVWVIEMYPKNDYYNAGKMICYVDKTAYKMFFRETYDRAGEYWKTILIMYSDAQAVDGSWKGVTSDCYQTVDDRAEHATYSNVIKYPGRYHELNVPLSKLGPNHFTVNSMMQLSK